MSSDDRLVVGHVAGPPHDDNTPVAVLLHGFTQNRHCWGPFATELGNLYTVVGIDLPGHGESAADDVSFERAAELIGEAIDTIDGPVDTLIGYSMGGRMALRLVLDRPGIASRLILVGATAGLERADDRRARRAADRTLADRLRAEGPERFLDFWLNLPLFEGLTDAQQCRAERLAHWGSGVPETLALRGTGSMRPLWDRIERIQIPVLVIAGADDDKFTRLGQQLVDQIGPSARFVSIPDAGHACHLQRPVETAAAVAAHRLGADASQADGPGGID